MLANDLLMLRIAHIGEQSDLHKLYPCPFPHKSFCSGWNEQSSFSKSRVPPAFPSFPFRVLLLPHDRLLFYHETDVYHSRQQYHERERG